MRLFIDEHELPWESAWEITRATVAYTNHTLMPEALERWPVDLLGARGAAPSADHLRNQSALSGRGRSSMAGGRYRIAASRVSIIEDGHDAQVRMAHLAIVGSHSINGVSKLHSELVKTRLVPEFYQLWPEALQQQDQRRDAAAMAVDGQSGAGESARRSRSAADGSRTSNSSAESNASPTTPEFQRRFVAIKRANKERLARIVQSDRRRGRRSGLDLRRPGQAHPRVQASTPDGARDRASSTWPWSRTASSRPCRATYLMAGKAAPATGPRK